MEAGCYTSAVRSAKRKEEWLRRRARGDETLGQIRGFLAKSRGARLGWPGLTEGQARLAQYLWDHGPATSRQITTALGLYHHRTGNSWVWKCLAALKAAGLVAGTWAPARSSPYPSRQPRRGVCVVYALTEAGRQVRQRALPGGGRRCGR